MGSGGGSTRIESSAPSDEEIELLRQSLFQSFASLQESNALALQGLNLNTQGLLAATTNQTTAASRQQQQGSTLALLEGMIRNNSRLTNDRLASVTNRGNNQALQLASRQLATTRRQENDATNQLMNDSNNRTQEWTKRYNLRGR